MTLSHNAKLGTDKNKPQEFLRGSFTPSSTHRVSSKAVSWKQTIHCNDMAAYSPYITADYNYTPYPGELHTHTPSHGGEIRSAQASPSTSSQGHLP